MKAEGTLGKLTFDGVRFRVWSDDHPPMHVHGYCGDAAAVIELSNPESVLVRKGSQRPANARASDIRRILRGAEEHYFELVELWRKVHG